ncbi:MAG: hypothetical protein QXX30_04580 [Candidatus Aenigmatarchaeota archaeon]
MDFYYHILSTKSWCDCIDISKIEEIHYLIDSSKEAFSKYTHRAVFHHLDFQLDIEWMYPEFKENAKKILRQHILEDLGQEVTLEDWGKEIKKPNWYKEKSPEEIIYKITKKYKGTEKDYIDFIDFMNRYDYINNFEFKVGNIVTHHTYGYKLVKKRFGAYIKNSRNISIPTLSLFEDFLKWNYNFVPNLTDWLVNVRVRFWMYPHSKLLFKKINN